MTMNFDHVWLTAPGFFLHLKGFSGLGVLPLLAVGDHYVCRRQTTNGDNRQINQYFIAAAHVTSPPDDYFVVLGYRENYIPTGIMITPTIRQAQEAVMRIVQSLGRPTMVDITDLIQPPTPEADVETGRSRSILLGDAVIGDRPLVNPQPNQPPTLQEMVDQMMRGVTFFGPHPSAADYRATNGPPVYGHAAPRNAGPYVDHSARQTAIRGLQDLGEAAYATIVNDRPTPDQGTSRPATVSILTAAAGQIQQANESLGRIEQALGVAVQSQVVVNEAESGGMPGGAPEADGLPLDIDVSVSSATPTITSMTNNELLQLIERIPAWGIIRANVSNAAGIRNPLAETTRRTPTAKLLYFLASNLDDNRFARVMHRMGSLLQMPMFFLSANYGFPPDIATAVQHYFARMELETRHRAFYLYEFIQACLHLWPDDMDAGFARALPVTRLEDALQSVRDHEAVVEQYPASHWQGLPQSAWRAWVTHLITTMAFGDYSDTPSGT